MIRKHLITTKPWGRCVLAILVLVLLGGSPALADYQFQGQDLMRHGREFGFLAYDRNGRYLGRRGAVYGAPVPYAQLPTHLIQALVAKEDREFFLREPGREGHLLALGKGLLAGRGGSTLSMQVVKNTLLDGDLRRERSKAVLAERKALELIKVGQLEAQFSKEEILTLYLNRVAFGENRYGVAAASAVYFCHGASQLNLLESAILVGSLTAPSALNPFRSFSRALDKAKLVLKLMVQEGYISPAQERAALAGATALQTQVGRCKTRLQTARRQQKRRYGRVLDLIEVELARKLEGARGDFSGLPMGPLRVTTTLDLRLQQPAESYFSEALDRHPGVGGGGVAVLANRTGQLLALVDGRPGGKLQYRTMSQARVPVGSAFKLFPWLQALERGLTPSSKVSGRNVEALYGQPVTNQLGGYPATVSLERALALSMNTVAVRLTDGFQREVIQLARRLGVDITHLPEDLSTLAMGSGNVRPLALLGAYATVLNGGLQVQPELLLNVRSGQKVLYRWTLPAKKQVLKPQVAKDMRQMLRQVAVMGTAKGLNLPSYARVKTGSTGQTASFFGGGSSLSTGVVMFGREDGTGSVKTTGAGAPGQVWKRLMNKANALYQGRPPS